MMQKVLPDVKKVGLLYCTAESNSDVQIKAAKKELNKLGLEYTDFTVSSSNEIQSVVESAVGKVDALYSPTDNTIAAGASQVGQICKENKLPFVTGEEGMCMAGGLFTLSINYKDLGYAAGEMAVKILKGEAKPRICRSSTSRARTWSSSRTTRWPRLWVSTFPLWTSSTMRGNASRARTRATAALFNI